MPEVGQTITFDRKGLRQTGVIEAAHPGAFTVSADGTLRAVLAHDVIPVPAPVDSNDNSDPGDEHTPPPVPTDDGFVLGSIPGSFVGSILPAEIVIPERVAALVPTGPIFDEADIQTGETGEVMTPIAGDFIVGEGAETADALPTVTVEQPNAEAPVAPTPTPAPKKPTKAERKKAKAAAKATQEVKPS